MAKKIYTWGALNGVFNHAWDHAGKVFHTTDRDGVDIYVVRYFGGYKNIIFKYYGGDCHV